MCGSVITIPRNDNLLNETIHVETKGELGNVLADYDYARTGSLKIVCMAHQYNNANRSMAMKWNNHLCSRLIFP